MIGQVAPEALSGYSGPTSIGEGASPYQGGYTPGPQGLTPSVSALMTWLRQLHGASQPIPPILTQLMRLHGFATPGGPGYNPDSTTNQKYTSYQI